MTLTLDKGTEPSLYRLIVLAHIEVLLNWNGELPKVKVKIDPRLKTTLGLAHCDEGLIRLNPRLPPEMVKLVYTHELAHLLAWQVRPSRGYHFHDRLWRSIMRDLGFPPKARI